MATREIGLIEKKIDRALGLIEQSATRVLRTRENGNREIGRAWIYVVTWSFGTKKFVLYKQVSLCVMFSI